ncbi:MAG: hypothetical protein ACRDMX_00155 [Solirubrobacteraceae bacterium]
MNVLVVTSEPVSAAALRDALGEHAASSETTEVMVVAPALHDGALRFWLSDADEAIERADWVQRQTARELDAAGIDNVAATGESEPLDAIADALAEFDAERIVLFVHPPDEQRYHERIDPAELQERFGLPVDRATVSA